MFQRKKQPEEPLPPLPKGARAVHLQRLEWGNTYMEEIVFPSGERLLPSGEIIPPPDNLNPTNNGTTDTLATNTRQSPDSFTADNLATTTSHETR